MGWFKKKENVIDLAGEYHLDKKINAQKTPSPQKESSSQGGMFGIFGDNSASSGISTTESESSLTIEERRQRLAKRLKDMTEKIEDLSNQIYHLQQRIELLEKKSDANRY